MHSLAFPVAMPAAEVRIEGEPPREKPRSLTEVYRHIDRMMTVWARTSELTGTDR